MKGAKIIKGGNIEIYPNIVKDKHGVAKMIKKDDFRFNDLKVSLIKLSLNEKMCKNSPLVRIEMSLRD